MEIHDNEIRKLYRTLNLTCKINEAKTGDDESLWPLKPKDEIILRGDMAIELGGGLAAGLGQQLFTFDKDLVPQSRVQVIGPDISDIPAGDVNYARFTIVGLKQNLMDEAGPDKLYGIFKKIDYLKYNLYLEGCAVRISSKASRESIRVSRRARDAGISLLRIGNTLINEYLKLEEVERAAVIYVTGFSGRGKDGTDIAGTGYKAIDFGVLGKIASRSEDITESYNTIFKGLNMDCSTCAQKSLCDEIDGMKKLHSEYAAVK